VRGWWQYYRARLRWLKFFMLMMSVLLFLVTASAAEASSSYDGQNPVQAGCTTGAKNIGGENSIAVNEFSATFEILTSPSCPYALWVAVHVSSGASGQYLVKIKLSDSGSGETTAVEEAVHEPLIQSDMLSDAYSCVNALTVVTSLNGDTESTVEDQLCNQGFGFIAPFEPPPPGGSSGSTTQSTTSTTTVTSTTQTTSSAGSSEGPAAPAKSVHRYPIHPKKCFGRHHRRVKCKKPAKHKKG
jgi:hypothetical protein